MPLEKFYAQKGQIHLFQGLKWGIVRFCRSTGSRDMAKNIWYQVFLFSRFCKFFCAIFSTSLGPLSRSIWGTYRLPIFLRFRLPDFLCMPSWSWSFQVKIHKIVDFLLMANFWGFFLWWEKNDQFWASPPLGNRTICTTSCKFMDKWIFQDFTTSC